MTPPNKPLPRLNGDNQPFWEGCRRHELRFQRCRACGLVRWPPAILCPQCHSQETEWVVSGGIGKVYTFAVYHTAYHQAFEAELPYVVAVVALAEGPHLLTNLIGCALESVTCEMPVQVVWEDVDATIALPKFKPL